MLALLKTIFFFLLVSSLSISLCQSTYEIHVDYKTQSLPFGLEEKVSKDKPTIALALSGGGSRGLAQIGVLRALEEAGIKIDMIVGTSMGSIIGGLYAAGYSVDQLDSIATNTDWDDLLSPGGETDRRELFVDQKVTEDKAILTLRLNGLSPIIPTSINTGHKLSNYLNLLTLQAPVHSTDGFDDLKIKFRAVCTDLIKGEPVSIDGGSLSQAMRASSSVSFFLSPVVMDSMILVDGGLVANIPVKIASELGADIVIAVNTTSNLYSKEELELPWIIADQVISIPMKLLNENQLSFADIVISPDVGDKSATDFNNLTDIINEGYTSALSITDKIKSKIDSTLITTFSDSDADRYFSNIKNHDDAFPWEKEILKKYAMRDSVSLAEIKKDLYDSYESRNLKDLRAEISDEGEFVDIRFIPGYDPQIKMIECWGITVLEKTKVDSVVRKYFGKAYNGTTVYSVIVDILNLYRTLGYSLAALEEMNFDDFSGRLSLSFDEGIISQILVKGNEITNSNIITREFPTKAGDYFRHNEISTGLTNLRSTNLFEDLILTVEKEDKRNIVILKVSERTSGLLRLGFRTDNEKNAQLSFDIRDENLFGTATELGILLYGGARNRGYVIEHKANRIFDTYLTYKIDAYYQFEDVYTYENVPTGSERFFSRSRNGEYRQIYYGASASIGTQVEKFGNLIFKGKYQFDEIKNLDRSPQNPYKTKIVSLKINGTIDSQDKYPYPNNGVYFIGSYETASSFLGGNVGFTNLGFDYKSYFTINDVHTLSPRVMMGFGDKTLPLSQQYSLGGQNSFFGMRENEFRGRQLFLSSLEYTMQLPFDIFFDTYIRLRYDLGSIWEEQEQIKFKDLRHGVGGTISFDTPVGPADFSVGRSFLFVKNLPDNPVSWGDLLFYFSIGYYY
jgi:NTE family protein